MAQPAASVTGSVTDPEGLPLPGAHVYLAGTMQGTVTRSDGTYSLRLALGAHRLAASMVGYTVSVRELQVYEETVYEVDFVLSPTVTTMDAVEVVAHEDRRWQRRLEYFQRTLFGTSSLADSVRLLNPEVLDFSGRLGRLTATARSPLEIENRALGYRIRYDLEVFDALPHRVRYHGEPLFEEMEPRDREEAARWAQARQRAYRGSLRHLLRALANDAVRPEGFDLYLLPDEGPASRARGFTPPSLRSLGRPARASAIVREGDDKGMYRLAFRGLLVIRYDGEPEDERFPMWEWNTTGSAHTADYQRSEIYVEHGGALFDARGELADPFSVTRRGYLAFRRLAMLLPLEYGL